MAYINITEIIYPVGSIYCSTESISPSERFGGTWIQVTDERFWLPSNEFGVEDGEAAHKLSIEEMPHHYHRLQVPVYNSFSPSQSIGYTAAFANNTNYTTYWIDGSWNRKEIANSNNGAWVGIGFTGGDEPHNTMPSYRTCYSWYRIS